MTLRSIYLGKNRLFLRGLHACFPIFLIKRQNWRKEPVTFNFGMLVATFQLTLAAVEYYNFQQSFANIWCLKKTKRPFLFWTQKLYFSIQPGGAILEDDPLFNLNSSKLCILSVYNLSLGLHEYSWWKSKKNPLVNIDQDERVKSLEKLVSGHHYAILVISDTHWSDVEMVTNSHGNLAVLITG